MIDKALFSLVDFALKPYGVLRIKRQGERLEFSLTCVDGGDFAACDHVRKALATPGGILEIGPVPEGFRIKDAQIRIEPLPYQSFGF